MPQCARRLTRDGFKPIRARRAEKTCDVSYMPILYHHVFKEGIPGVKFKLKVWSVYRDSLCFIRPGLEISVSKLPASIPIVNFVCAVHNTRNLHLE